MPDEDVAEETQEDEQQEQDEAVESDADDTGPEADDITDEDRELLAAIKQTAPGWGATGVSI